MTADGEALSEEFLEVLEIGTEKERMAIVVTHVLGLNEESTEGMMVVLHAREIERWTEGVFPIHIVGEQENRALSVGYGGKPDSVRLNRFVPGAEQEHPHICPRLKDIDVMPFGITVAVHLTSQHHILKADATKVRAATSERFSDESRTAICKARQHFGRSVRLVTIRPKNISVFWVSQPHFLLLRAI